MGIFTFCGINGLSKSSKVEYAFEIGQKVQFIGPNGVYGYQTGEIYTIRDLIYNPQNGTKWVRTKENPISTLESDFKKYEQN